jgi:hypothetical protein
MVVNPNPISPRGAGLAVVVSWLKTASTRFAGGMSPLHLNTAPYRIVTIDSIRNGLISRSNIIDDFGEHCVDYYRIGDPFSLENQPLSSFCKIWPILVGKLMAMVRKEAPLAPLIARHQLMPIDLMKADNFWKVF